MGLRVRCETGDIGPVQTHVEGVARGPSDTRAVPLFARGDTLPPWAGWEGKEKGLQNDGVIETVSQSFSFGVRTAGSLTTSGSPWG